MPAADASRGQPRSIPFFLPTDIPAAESTTIEEALTEVLSFHCQRSRQFPSSQKELKNQIPLPKSNESVVK
jgi:hypothetical protein